MVYPTDPNVALTGCPYLGSCGDRDTFYAFPSFENCCHSEAQPTTVEPSYQAEYCLGQKWSDCPRYIAAQTGTELPEPVKAGFPGLPSWAIAGIAVGVVLLLVALLLILSPKEPPSEKLTPTEGLLTVTAAVAGTAIAAQSATPTATFTATPRPSPSATATWTATYTPTSTRTPTPTRTRRPTRTPTPTATATRTPMPTATSTRAPLPTATATPLPAPTLLSPADGQVFPYDAAITLAWEPVEPLPSDAYYAITVAYAHNGEPWKDDVPWTKETSWMLSEHRYLLDQGLSDDGRFSWSVQLMQQTGSDANGKPTGTPRSPASKVRTLIWLLPLGPGSLRTPPPPPP